MTSTSQGNGQRVTRLVASVVAVLCAGLTGSARALPPSVPAPGAYTTDGPVQAIAHAGGRTYIGGAFTRVGKRSGSGIVLSPKGDVVPSAEVAGGDVYAAVSDRNGGWYVGGSFTAVGGEPHVGLAHVNGDGSVDSGFKVTVTDAGGNPAPVYALELSPVRPDGDRTLYVGGEFARIGVRDLQGRRNMAALNASNGTVVPDFSPMTVCAFPPSCEGAVRSLALAHVPVSGAGGDQPVLFVGGDFTKIGSPENLAMSTWPVVKGLAAVWGVGATDETGVPVDGVVVNADSPWRPAVSEYGTELGKLPASVRTIQVGPAVERACSPATCSVLAVYVGGWRIGRKPDPANPFILIPDPGPVAAAFQFKLNKTTRRASTAEAFANWKPNPAGCPDCAVQSTVLRDSAVSFGGEFTKVGTPAVDAGYLGRIPAIPDPNVTTFTANAARLGAGVDGPVRSLARSAGSEAPLVAAGVFSERVVGLVSGSGERLGDWTSPSPDSPVHVLAADATGSTSSIYAGGVFRSLNAVERRGLAAFDSSGTLLDWAPDVSGGAGQAPLVHALAASDSTVYVGGQFDATPGPGGANLAALDATSGAPASTMPDVTLSGGQPDVLSLSVSGSTLYAGGVFDGVGGEARANLAALDAGTGAVTGWSPRVLGSQAAVRAILPACGAVYVGGWFGEAGGQPRENLAALDAGTGAATGWNPHPDGAVLALARYGPTIYAGGTFSRIADESRQRLAGLNASDGHVTQFDAGIDAQTLGTVVRGLAASDSALYLGGHFATAGGAARSHLAAVDPSSGHALEWDPRVDARVNALALGDDAVYAGGAFASAGATGQRGFAGLGAGAGAPFGAGGCPLTTAIESTGSVPADTSTSRPSGVRTATPRPVRPAVLSRVVVRPATLTSRRTALTVRFTLSRASRVRLVFERQVRRACRTGPAGAARRRVCVRYVRFSSVTARGRKGVNRVSFRGLRVGGRRLVPGRYRLRLATLPAAAGAGRGVIAFLRVRAGGR